MTVQQINYRGRKGKIGGVCFDGNQMAFFAGYHQCEDCGNRGKILLNLDESRALAQKIGGNRSKEPLGLRISRKIAKRYENI